MIDPLDALRIAKESQRALDAEISYQVRQAKAGGASWQAVADALGVSRQAAHHKYRETGPDIETLPLDDPIFDVLFTTKQE